MGKSEDRAHRRAEKLEKFEASKAKLIERVVANQQPKAAFNPLPAEEPRVATTVNTSVDKAPKSVVDGGRFASQVTWCVTQIDHQGQWSWHEPRKWTDGEWTQTIHPAFQQIGQMTWAQVDSFASGSEHKMHHAQSFDRIIDEAQERWMTLSLGEFADSIFRFRLGGARRAWGYIVQAHFHMVWWERNHKIHRKRKGKKG